MAMILVPAQTLVMLAAGYALDRWPAAIFLGGLAGVGGAVGAWLATRRTGL
jgi:hypothetical protein